MHTEWKISNYVLSHPKYALVKLKPMPKLMSTNILLLIPPRNQLDLKELFKEWV